MTPYPALRPSVQTRQHVPTLNQVYEEQGGQSDVRVLEYQVASTTPPIDRC